MRFETRECLRRASLSLATAYFYERLALWGPEVKCLLEAPKDNRLLDYEKFVMYLRR